MKFLICLVFLFSVCYSSRRGNLVQREKFGDRINSEYLAI